MRKVGHMLSPALGRDEVIRAARAQRVLRDWPLIVGEDLAGRSFPDRYDHGTVWVAVTGSAWAQELRMQREQILQKLEERSGEPGLFHNIRFGVRALPEPKEAKAPQASTASKAEKRTLTIKEIAEQRLKNWPDDGSSSK